MTTVITAPENIDVEGFKVFLAGAIDMGEAPDWQAQAIEMLGNQSHLIIFNPRRKEFTEDTLDEQIHWELKALDKADVILMWYPATAEAPVSLFETGLYLNSGKLIVGVEPGYFRQRNLELTAEYYNVPLWNTLRGATEEVLLRYSTRQK